MSTLEAVLFRIKKERPRRIVAFTGAGISAESGIPTFRGATGLWQNFRPEELATPEAFARDPELVWEWYEWRRDLIRRAAPNAAHLALATLERDRSADVTVVTQNVDGLHRRAGSSRVLELHARNTSVEINPQPTALTAVCSESVAAAASHALPPIVEAILAGGAL